MNNNQSEKIQIEGFTARKMEKFRYQSKKKQRKVNRPANIQHKVIVLYLVSTQVIMTIVSIHFNYEITFSNIFITLFHVNNIVSSVQFLSRVQLFAIPWTAACQAFLSITNSQSLLNLMSIESVMPSNHLILCLPLLLLPSIIPSIRVFSNQSALCIRWPKYWNFSFQYQFFPRIFRVDFLQD